MPTNKWQLADYHPALTPAVNEVLDTDMEPSNITEPRGDGQGLITVRGSELIAVRGFGVGADDNTIDLRIMAWMDNGPGDLLLQLTDLKIGASSITEKPIGGVPDDTWRAVDDWPGASVEANQSEAYVTVAPTQAGFLSNTLILPTLSYSYLRFQATGLGDAEASVFIWRPIHNQSLAARTLAYTAL